MKLLASLASPYTRKVRVVLAEKKIDCEMQLVDVAPVDNPVNRHNPLGKIPTLVLDDGAALYDSRVICEYFDTLHDGAKLFPTDPGLRWTALRLQALGDGLMEVIVLRLGEQARTREGQSQKHLAAYRLKIVKTLDVLAAEAEGLAAPISIGHIAIGCALAHLDFRFAADDWRAGRAKLATWYAGFARRPSMQATEYVDAY
jgi:glutathione S-transferase